MFKVESEGFETGIQIHDNRFKCVPQVVNFDIVLCLQKRQLRSTQRVVELS